MIYQKYAILAAGVAVLVCLVSVSSVMSARPSYYGYSPAYPKTSEILPLEKKVPFTANERTMAWTLAIDKAGAVKKVLPTDLGDSQFVDYALPSLQKLAFEPAVIGETMVASGLPILVNVNPRFRTTTIEFPIDTEMQIKNSSLYFESLEKLGIVFPAIEKFPSYFCDLKSSDSLDRLPYILLKLELDSAGKVSSSDVLRAGLPAFAPQIQSASLWAEFSPLRLNKMAHSSVCFLLILFFPQLPYPTTETQLSGDIAYHWYDKWRLRLVPDTVGLMLPPMPKQNKIDELALAKEDRILRGEVIASVVVDTLGNIRVGSTDLKRPVYHKAIRTALKDARFFAATNYDGIIANFHGRARFLFSANANVKVHYFWLDK